MFSPSSMAARLTALALLCITTATCHRGKPAISCDAIPAPSVPGAQVLSLTTALHHNWTGPAYDPSTGTFTTSPPLSVCTVNITLLHPGARAPLTVWVWLPLKDWNGRFQGAGGGGWQAGTHSFSSLGLSAAQGYAAASTDGSDIFRADGLDRALFLEPGGVLDLERMADFSYRGLHAVAVVGKAVTASFYGTQTFRSYWNGCSQGGRQGFEIAQRYPEDFDGIMANAPGIYWPNLLLAMGWGRQVLRILDYTPAMCVMEEFKTAAIAACDALDGVRDGVISDPDACAFDPASLVGREVDCGLGGRKTVTAKDAAVAAMIRAGPRAEDGSAIWEGYGWGTDYLGLLPSAVTGAPNTIDVLSDAWIQYFIKRNPDFDMSTLTTVEQFIEFFAVAYADWSDFIAADVADLSGFKKAGGKLISWHGTADELIPVNNSIRYRERVEGVMGGGSRVDDFYKFYVAPGAGHCAGGVGANPQNVMKKLEAWVEKGEKPDILRGSMKDLEGKDAERIICPFPLVARYNGKSDPKKASSYRCAKSY